MFISHLHMSLIPPLHSIFLTHFSDTSVCRALNSSLWQRAPREKGFCWGVQGGRGECIAGMKLYTVYVTSIVHFKRSRTCVITMWEVNANEQCLTSLRVVVAP